MYSNFSLRFFTIISIVLGLQSSIIAQNAYRTSSEKLRKADEFFYILNYAEAINLYKDVLRKEPGDTTVICKIANSFRLMGKSEEAETWYRKVISDSLANVKADYVFQFAQTLSVNSKYSDALSWYRHYHKLNPLDKRALDAIRSLEDIRGLYRDSVFYEVHNLPINSSLTELAPRPYKDGIIFLSDRDDKLNRMLSRYYLKAEGPGKEARPVKFTMGPKVQFNEGALSFYNNFSKVIFSQNYIQEKSELRKGTAVPFHLYSADCDSVGWHNMEMLPFQDAAFSYSQPFITEDGLTLYFSSDMPGGFGGYDLYAVTTQNGQWGNPYNLGPSVNTPGDEMFPFMNKGSELYFSSNGRGGLGELDIFRITLGDSLSLKNMGNPINSSYDDFGFFLDNTGRNGYFSSNRNNDLTGDDIYSFKQVKKSVKIRVVDELSGMPIQFSDITFTDSLTLNQFGKTDSLGFVEVVVPLDDTVALFVGKKDFAPVKVLLDSNLDEFVPSVKLKVQEVADNMNHSTRLIYRVQVMASREHATKRQIKKKYKGDLVVTELFEDNWYKYVVGEYLSYSEAKAAETVCQVYDSFIVAYNNGKRVQVFFSDQPTN